MRRKSEKQTEELQQKREEKQRGEKSTFWQDPPEVEFMTGHQ